MELEGSGFAAANRPARTGGDRAFGSVPSQAATPQPAQRATMCNVLHAAPRYGPAQRKRPQNSAMIAPEIAQQAIKPMASTRFHFVNSPEEPGKSLS